MTCTTALDSLNSLSLIFVIHHSLIPSLIPKLALDVKPGLWKYLTFFGFWCFNTRVEADLCCGTVGGEASVTVNVASRGQWLHNSSQTEDPSGPFITSLFHSWLTQRVWLFSSQCSSSLSTSLDSTSFPLLSAAASATAFCHLFLIGHSLLLSLLSAPSLPHSSFH